MEYNFPEVPKHHMSLKTLKMQKNLRGKRVLLRVDFNVPIAHGKVKSDADSRILAALPTIDFLRKSGAKTIIVAHLGRPEGREKKFSLAPVANYLAKGLGENVLFVKENLEQVGKVERALSPLKDGGIAMLENIRFYKGEKMNDAGFARRLASLGDLYVDDAFADAHRDHASITSIAAFLPSVAGFLMETEVTQLSKLLQRPKRPFVVLLGGAKVADKLPVIERMQKLASTVLVGGGMANAFLRAKGFQTGRSTVTAAEVKIAKRFLKKKNVLIPIDVLTAKRLDDRAQPIVRKPKEVRRDEFIIDVGVETIRAWSTILKKAKTIVWNGPVGLFEVKKFSHGSLALGRVIAARSSGEAFGVVGGGETVQCLERTGMAQFVDHVSSGGGAMLEFLAGETLPGVKVLKK